MMRTRTNSIQMSLSYTHAYHHNKAKNYPYYYFHTRIYHDVFFTNPFCLIHAVMCALIPAFSSKMKFHTFLPVYSLSR